MHFDQGNPDPLALLSINSLLPDHGLNNQQYMKLDFSVLAVFEQRVRERDYLCSAQFFGTNTDAFSEFVSHELRCGDGLFEDGLDDGLCERVESFLEFEHEFV